MQVIKSPGPIDIVKEMQDKDFTSSGRVRDFSFKKATAGEGLVGILDIEQVAQESTAAAEAESGIVWTEDLPQYAKDEEDIATPDLLPASQVSELSLENLVAVKAESGIFGLRDLDQCSQESTVASEAESQSAEDRDDITAPDMVPASQVSELCIESAIAVEAEFGVFGILEIKQVPQESTAAAEAESGIVWIDDLPQYAEDEEDIATPDLLPASLVSEVSLESLVAVKAESGIFGIRDLDQCSQEITAASEAESLSAEDRDDITAPDMVPAGQVSELCIESATAVEAEFGMFGILEIKQVPQESTAAAEAGSGSELIRPALKQPAVPQGDYAQKGRGAASSDDPGCSSLADSDALELAQYLQFQHVSKIEAEQRGEQPADRDVADTLEVSASQVSKICIESATAVETESGMFGILDINQFPQESTAAAEAESGIVWIHDLPQSAEEKVDIATPDAAPVSSSFGSCTHYYIGDIPSFGSSFGDTVADPDFSWFAAEGAAVRPPTWKEVAGRLEGRDDYKLGDATRSAASKLESWASRGKRKDSYEFGDFVLKKGVKYIASACKGGLRKNSSELRAQDKEETVAPDVVPANSSSGTCTQYYIGGVASFGVEDPDCSWSAVEGGPVRPLTLR